MSREALEKITIWTYLREYAELREQILQKVDDVFSSGRLILGEYVERFERELAEYIGVLGGASVNSGTDALHIGLVAQGVGPGDEVITVSNTAIPTVAAIVAAGAKPVFVDINADDYLINVDQIPEAITPRTKAILPVHLYGQCADMDRISQIAADHGLLVLEDCAQAFGALYRGRKAGSLGHAAAFSFYPTKILGGYGDGGWVGSNDPIFNAMVRSLRAYGTEGAYYSERHGFNSRLDEVQAAILSLKITHTEGWIEQRRQIANKYTKALSSTCLVLPLENPGNRHVYYNYVIDHINRDALMKRLAEQNIYCKISYPHPIHTMRGYAYLGYRTGQFPITEAKAARIFSLPMYPQLCDEEVERIISVLVEAS
jgi:aminotransferase EvaB